MVSLQGQRIIRSFRSQPRTWKAKTKCYIIKCWRLTAAVLKETRVEWFTTFFYFWKWTHCSRFGIFFYLKYKKITVIVLRLIVRSEGISCMYMEFVNNIVFKWLGVPKISVSDPGSFVLIRIRIGLLSRVRIGKKIRIGSGSMKKKDVKVFDPLCW